METLHRLAGMTETSNPHDHPMPKRPSIPPDSSDTDTRDTHSIRASRASIPLNRRGSRHSLKSNRSAKSGRGASPVRAPADYPPPPSAAAAAATAAAMARTSQESGAAGSGEEAEGEAEFTWGPSHPCFPHTNTHCAPDSSEYRTTRVIRVRRDWLQAGDLYPQYANLYPEILDPLVSDADFRILITNLNARLKEIFDPYATRAWVDAVMGAATGYVWDDLGLTGAKRAVRSLEAFVEKWNARKAEEGLEVRMVQLRRTGFMTLDFVVPDPGIDGVVEERGDEEGGIGPAE